MVIAIILIAVLSAIVAFLFKTILNQKEELRALYQGQDEIADAYYTDCQQYETTIENRDKTILELQESVEALDAQNGQLKATLADVRAINKDLKERLV